MQVLIPLMKMKSVEHNGNIEKPSGKYVQIVTLDNLILVHGSLKLLKAFQIYFSSNLLTGHSVFIGKYCICRNLKLTIENVIVLASKSKTLIYILNS